MTQPFSHVPSRFTVFYHPKLKDSFRLAEEITNFIIKRGAFAEFSSVDDEAKRARAIEADMLIALGGDGTMLKVARTGAFNDKPVLGINLGRFGFLVDVQPSEWPETLIRVLNNDYRIEERLMLHASHCQSGMTLSTHEVLNEVVIARGSIIRPIRLQAMVDGAPLTTYVADGLIVATPTGSTAYALAAGGPILPPSAQNILLVPIAPHLTMDRAIVLPSDSVLNITVRTEHQALFSADGQVSVPMQDQDTLQVRVSRNAARFVRMTPPSYFYKTLADRMAQNPSADKAK